MHYYKSWLARISIEHLADLLPGLPVQVSSQGQYWTGLCRELNVRDVLVIILLQVTKLQQHLNTTLSQHAVSLVLVLAAITSVRHVVSAYYSLR